MVKIHTIARLLACLALMSFGIPAQTRAGRGLTGGWEDGLTRGSSIIIAEASGAIRVSNPGASGYATAQFQTGISALGAYEALGTNVVDGLLVAGRDSSGGRVEHWASTSNGWVLNSAVTIPGADFTGVAVVGPSVFLLDCVTSTILTGLWDPQAQLGTTSLSVLATATEVPVLTGANRLLMYGLETGEAVNLPGPGVFLFSLLETNMTKGGTLVRGMSGSLTVETFIYAPFAGVTGVVARGDIAKAGDTTLLVKANGAINFEVVDGSSTVLGSAVGSVTGGETLVTLSQPLEVGQIYTARVVGQSAGESFRCVERYGFPEQFSDASQLRRIQASGYRVGNAQFAIRSDVLRPSYSGPDRIYYGAMILGLGGSPILPFDNGQGLNQILDSAYWVGALGSIGLDEKRGSVKMSFPIPADPAWEGVVLRGQFVIFDDVGIRLSEVVGMKVQPSL